jgi:gamma-butyrobetaine dioxygenase
MKNNKFTIKNVTITSTAVDIEWDDGEISHFHFLWLRDNCQSGMHPDARMRVFNLLDVSEKIHPLNYSLDYNGNLKFLWSEKNHESIYSSKWLRNNCYTIKSKKKIKSPYVLWDSLLEKNINLIKVEYNEIMDSDAGLLKWLEKLHNYGLAVVTNSPTNKNSGFKILNRISHIRETFFGTPFEVINIPKPNNTAYTAEALRNHTDLPYFEYTPGYQFLHCLVNDSTGGMSTTVDGFSIANYLRNEEPETFNLLIKTIIKFKDDDFTQNKKRTFYSPLITLTKDKDFNDIRFSMAAMGIIDINPDLMEIFYKAYRRFASLLHSKKNVVNFRLKAGDIFSFNNRRVLHGRTEFDPNSGHRHLQGYYLDRDEIVARLNYLQNTLI